MHTRPECCRKKQNSKKGLWRLFFMWLAPDRAGQVPSRNLIIRGWKDTRNSQDKGEGVSCLPSPSQHCLTEWQVCSGALTKSEHLRSNKLRSPETIIYWIHMYFPQCRVFFPLNNAATLWDSYISMLQISRQTLICRGKEFRKCIWYCILGARVRGSSSRE